MEVTGSRTKSPRFSLLTLMIFVTSCCITLAYFKHYGLQAVIWFIAALYLWRKSQFQDVSKDVRAIAFVILALVALDYLA